MHGGEDSQPLVLWLLDRKLEALFSAIAILLEHDLWEPALILIYSGIDAMAWLDRPATSPRVTGTDFAAWAETYLLPNAGLAVSGADLYSARCGLLHTHTGESDLHDADRAEKVWYVRRQGEAQRCIVQLNLPEKRPPSFLDLDDLASGLHVATDRFQRAVSGNPEKLELVRDRVHRFYFSEGMDFE